MIKIEDELKNDFLDYATSVNNERAFPDVRDSLKPVQRAILWDMYLNKYFSSKVHTKCAKITGSVIGRWHPHGDASVYEALVRMSQDWIYHKEILPIDFHGAMGSRIGGPTPASSRYTEARLSKFSEDNFFKNIDKNVVNMIDNFSEDDKWPEVFPSILPMLLLSQVSGIGYTIANDWLPHNLNDIFEKVKEYIDTNKISIDNLYPDFPTGGVIINKSDCHTIYETGQGTVILRGKAEIMGNHINITELPYQVYVEPFIQKIKDLINTGVLTGIEDICNKSDDSGMLIEIECSGDKIDTGIILNKLYKLTDLQIKLSANQYGIVDGIPQLLNLEDYIKIYVNHNINCLQKEYKFDLEKASERLEIVTGLIKAISNIDKIIEIIKASKSLDIAKNNLTNNFGFTENQAKAIVDMRLGKLANIEILELNKEEAELNKVIKNCTKILASDKLQKNEFIHRLSEFVAKYGWERKTKVLDLDLAHQSESTQYVKKEEQLYNIYLTDYNEIKKVNINKITKNKTDNSIINCLEKLTNNDRFIAIDEYGTMYKPILKDFIEQSLNSSGKVQQTKILNIYSGKEPEEFIILITTNGKLHKIVTKDIFELKKYIGTKIMNVTDADNIIYCCLKNNNDTIIIYTNDGKQKEIKIKDIKAKGRTSQGIQCITFNKKRTSITSIK